MKRYLLCLLLTGCCKSFCIPDPCPPLVIPPPPPPVEAFIRPKLDIELMLPTATANEVFEAYVYSVSELIDHVTYLEKLLQGYK